MSCCGGNCGCGTGCKCGSGCGGCKSYPELGYSEATSASTAVTVLGVAPQMTYGGDGAESVECGNGENGCKCGTPCTCDPCNCK